MICLCKHWMHDSRLMQVPFVACPASRRRRLNADGPQSWAGSRPLTAKQVKAFQRTAKVLRSMRPWNMESAADYLNQWLALRAEREHPTSKPKPVHFLSLKPIAKEKPEAAWRCFSQKGQNMLRVRNVIDKQQVEGRPKAGAKAHAKARSKAKPKATAKAKGLNQLGAHIADGLARPSFVCMGMQRNSGSPHLKR